MTAVLGSGPDLDLAVGDPLARDTFAWQILSAMTDEVSEQSDDGRLWLSFRKAGGRG